MVAWPALVLVLVLVLVLALVLALVVAAPVAVAAAAAAAAVDCSHSGLVVVLAEAAAVVDWAVAVFAVEAVALGSTGTAVAGCLALESARVASVQPVSVVAERVS